jgi:hypothetical protein
MYYGLNNEELNIYLARKAFSIGFIDDILTCRENIWGATLKNGKP